MRSFAAAITLIGLTSSAAAADYGASPEVCDAAAKGFGKRDGLHLSETMIVDWEWGCRFSEPVHTGTMRGECYESEMYTTETFVFDITPERALVTFENGNSATLERCPE